jgi:uncharacterized membrane protein YbaN (DUF454 family)
MHPGQDRPPPPRRSPPPPRLLLLVVGYCSLAVAALGVVLPLLPTTPFLLLAAWAFGRASPELRERLRADRRFGPLLRDWEEQGAIGARAKRASLVGMGLCWLLLALLFRDALMAGAAGAWLVLGVAGACMAAVAVYVQTRPLPRRPPLPPDGGGPGG